MVTLSPMATDFVTEMTSMISNSTSNESVDEIALLEMYLGSRYRSTAETSILTVFYCAIFVTGVIGNVSTCIVIIRNGYMHTATNYYLFSLAVSDLMTLMLGLPTELYTIFEAYPWRFGEPYCQFKSFITEMTSTASVMTITAFTVERYVAICHPIRAQTMSNLSRAIKIIFIIWIMAALCTLPLPIHTKTYYYLTEPYTIEKSLICNIPREWMGRMKYYFQFSTFILFVLPMTVITWLYILIGLTLRRSGLSRQCSDVSSSSPQQSSSRRAVLKMLVAVVVAFFICWAPYHAQRLMTVYVQDDQWTKTLLEIQSVLFYSSGILYFISSTVNPILYNLMSRKYREAFKHTMCKCCLYKATRGRAQGGHFLSDRSQTYVTMAGTTRILSDKNSYLLRSPMMSRNFGGRRQRVRKGEGCPLWERLKTFFTREKPEPNVRQARFANGSACFEKSGSRSSSPNVTVLVGQLRDEMEMEEVKSDLIPHDTNEDTDAITTESGTFL